MVDRIRDATCCLRRRLRCDHTSCTARSGIVAPGPSPMSSSTMSSTSRSICRRSIAWRRRLRLVSRDRLNVLSFRDRDHWVPPANDLQAVGARASPHGGARPGRLAHHAHRQPALPGIRIQPGQLLPLPGAGPASCGSCSSRSTTRMTSGTSTRSGPSVTARATMLRWTRTCMSRRSSPWTPATPCASRTIRAGAHRHHRGRTRGSQVLVATLMLRRARLTDRMLIRLLLRVPFVSHKTIAAIHLHAWRLWRRGVTFHRHPEVTR